MKKSINGKKGQIQLGFNWIYILIAGAIILLFFVSIVAKQKSSAEVQLSNDLVRILQSILTGAQVSEKTINTIDTSGLADYNLYFSCEDGFGEYGVEGGGGRVEAPIEAIFSPAKIKSTQLITWSLPYNLPYKVNDLLILSSINNKYFIYGTDKFSLDFINATEKFNIVKINNFAEAEASGTISVRIVDFKGEITSGTEVPSGLLELDDQKITAVSFHKGADNQERATYFQKDGSRWKAVGTAEIVSLSTSDNAKIAAVFAENAENYQCNMDKVFRRLRLISEIYEQKLREVGNFAAVNPQCLTEYRIVESSFLSYYREVLSCNTYLVLNDKTININPCLNLDSSANKLFRANKNLREAGNCIGLY